MAVLARSTAVLVVLVMVVLLTGCTVVADRQAQAAGQRAAWDAGERAIAQRLRRERGVVDFGYTHDFSTAGSVGVDMVTEPSGR